jgi:ABC-type transport system involved in cytochrome bd biosynthesis fused ATPase/permease subunit
MRLAKKRFRKYWGSYVNLGHSFLENVQGLTTFKIYGTDQEKHQEMNTVAEDFRKMTMKVLTMDAKQKGLKHHEGITRLPQGCCYSLFMVFS